MIPSSNGWKMSTTGLSRQLWWGHQIPAWYNAEGEIYVGEEAPEGDGWTQDEMSWILVQFCPLAILYHGLAGCRLRRL